MKFAAISGSLRAQSFNTRLIQQAIAMAKAEGITMELIDWSALPVFSEDLETPDGPPSSVKAFRDAVTGADFLLISTPEYNHSLPGGLKNAIDWGSRAPNVWGGKKIAIMGATVGAWGAVQAVREARHVLSVLGAQVQTHPMVNLPAASGAFNDQGELTNDMAKAALLKLIQGLPR
jgi:chromate reductase